MTPKFTVPEMFCGSHRSVKVAVSACVRQSNTPLEMIRRVQHSLVPADQTEGIFVVESLGADGQKKRSNYWCDILMVELDRKFEAVDEIRRWSEELLTVSWGGLTFLSQDANGVLQSPAFCRKYVEWMVCHATALNGLGARFSLTGRGQSGKIWDIPTNLGGALGAIGATMEDFPDREMTTFVDLARKLLAG